MRTWLPGLDPATAEAISCTYTTTPDSVFVLDRQGPVVVAAGFSGQGFKFVPAIGRVLADLAIDGRVRTRSSGSRGPRTRLSPLRKSPESERYCHGIGTELEIR